MKLNLKTLGKIITFLLLLISSPLKSQQLVQDLTSLYYLNWMNLNPGAVNYLTVMDKSKEYVLNGSYRQQWTGLDKGLSPTLYNVRFEKMDSWGKIGGLAQKYQAGHLHQVKFQLNYAYQLYFRPNMYLSLGLNAGYSNTLIKLNDVNWVDPTSAMSLFTENYNNWYPDFSFGAFFMHQFGDGNDFDSRDDHRLRRYYIGISVPRITSDSLHRSNSKNGVIDPYIPLYIMGGASVWVVEDSKKGLLFDGNLWGKWIVNGPFNKEQNLRPYSIEGSGRFIYANKVWLGAGYSTENILHLEFGLNKLMGGSLQDDEGFMLVSLGAGVDFGTGRLKQLGPAYEISIGISWR